MDKKKKKKIIVVFVVIAVLLLIWFLIIYPLIDFNKKEDLVLDASKDYFEKNNVFLPEEGEMSTVTLRTLYEQKYVDSMKTTYDKDFCSYDKSWVKVKRKNGKYDYYVYLDCGKMKSDTDHEGPVIKLNGKDEIEIEKGSKYNDEGIKSVIDNTDGKMDVKDVDVSGKVDTDKIGTYTIQYKISDSFENESVVTRKIKVIQTLNKVVEDSTDKDKIYKGNDVQNYIMFSNMLFRIVGLNSDGSVKIVASDNIGTVNYDDVDKWLNDYFYDHLTDKSTKYIVKGSFCKSTVSDKNVDTVKSCKGNKKENVGLLSISDYNNSVIDGNSYLYPNNIAWTSNNQNDNKAWAVRTYFSGNGTSKYMSFDDKYNFAVYPVINLKKGIKLIDGDGSLGDPYIFINKSKARAGDNINTRQSGEYVSYGNIKYRIIDVDKDGYTKVVSDAVVMTNSVGYENKDKAKIYNPEKKGNVGYYIENDLSKLIKTDVFTKHEVSVPIYKTVATYSGKKTTKKYKVKLSAPNMYELFSGTNGSSGYSYWLINSSEEELRKYLVSNIDVIYYNSVPNSEKAGIRVIGYLDKDVTVLSGKGTKTNPYVLEK